MYMYMYLTYTISGYQEERPRITHIFESYGFSKNNDFETLYTKKLTGSLEDIKKEYLKYKKLIDNKVKEEVKKIEKEISRDSFSLNWIQVKIGTTLCLTEIENLL